jgi:CBS domain-containing protein
MDRDPSIQSLFPKLFNASRAITTGSSALIVSGTMLHLDDVQLLPIVAGLQPKIDPITNVKMYATLGGYSVLQAVLKTSPNEYLKLLWSPCQDNPIWIGSVKYTDSYYDLLRIFDLTKFGDAAIEGAMSVPSLITLQEILPLFKSGLIRSKLRVSEISSEMIKVHPDCTLMETLEIMFEKRVRRVFLAGVSERESSEPAFPFVSTRDIIRFLFSPARLEIAKRDTEKWTEAKLSDIGMSYAKRIHSGKIVNQAANEIGKGIDDCLVTDDGNKVVSRWDIVMKPWKANNYSFQE